jgi:hypothetical protein
VIFYCIFTGGKINKCPETYSNGPTHETKPVSLDQSEQNKLPPMTQFENMQFDLKWRKSHIYCTFTGGKINKCPETHSNGQTHEKKPISLVQSEQNKLPPMTQFENMQF